MCIAIYKPSNKVIDRDTLHRCYLKNKDGCGFAYFKTGGESGNRELVIFKSMKFEEFYDEYEFHSVLNSDRPFLIHFRIATHGTVDLYNCHPFKIDDTHVMIHNGIIHNIRNCPDKKRSDTQMFVDDILKELPRNWMTNFGITNLIEDYIGQSKVVVLSADDTVTIYNEIKGEWSGDVWYSNSGYKERAVTYSWATDDYYGDRYGSYTKTTPHNYERPNIDPVTGEKLGVLYGRWEYVRTLGKCTWIEVPREEKIEIIVEDDIMSSSKVSIWKYDKDSGMMCEFVDGEYTGKSYIAIKGYGKKKEKSYLSLVPEQKQLPLISALPEREYETCCSCCQVLETDSLFVVDEFQSAEDCFLCERCIEEYRATGQSMSNPVKVSDLKSMEKEIQTVC